MMIDRNRSASERISGTGGGLVGCKSSALGSLVVSSPIASRDHSRKVHGRHSPLNWFLIFSFTPPQELFSRGISNSSRYEVSSSPSNPPPKKQEKASIISILAGAFCAISGWISRMLLTVARFLSFRWSVELRAEKSLRWWLTPQEMKESVEFFEFVCPPLFDRIWDYIGGDLYFPLKITQNC